MIDKLLVIGGVLLAVVATSTAVSLQEWDLSRSRTVLFELGPADPRSIVQGDFMRLRYVIERDLTGLPAGTEVVVRVDDRGVARFVRSANGEPLAPDEIRVDTFSRNRRNTIAPRAFLFEEGTADVYGVARFGMVAITPEGRTTLVGLADDEGHRLGPAPRRW